MLLRLSAMTPIHTRGMWIGTFHGLCNRMLRAHHRDANLPQLFQILDTQDQLSLIKRMYRAHGIDDDRYPPKQLQWFIAGAKDEGCGRTWSRRATNSPAAQVEHYALYDAMCQREGVVDFAELLLRSYELLAGNDALRGHYQRRFSHLLVDEFQDTNTLQYKWLRQLAGPDAAVLAVGDDDQSIYAFRGAKVANMQQFERDFATRGAAGDADQAGAELPVARTHPRRRQRADPPQPGAAGQEPVDQRGRGRAGTRLRGADGPGRGGVHRRRGQGTRRRRRCAGPRSRCCIAPMRSRGCWSMRCSARACRTASTAACATSSAPRSSTRWPTCA